MNQIEAGESAAAPAELRLRVLMVALVGAAALARMAARTWLAAVQPLWFDEAWAAFAAATPDWRLLVHEARVDVNAPLYYALLHAWTALAGPSDLALRVPGLLAVAAAGAIPLARRIPGLRFESRLAWGALIFGWWGIDIFLAGRCYGLLLALSTLQCVLFADLLRRPTRGAAFAWCAVAASAILTHYYALIGAGVQGLAYLAIHRRQALRTWPAALAFAPAAAWLAFHLPRLQAFTRQDVAWHAVVGPQSALGMAAFSLDPSSPLMGLALFVVALGAIVVSLRAKSEPAARPLWIAAAASFATLAATLVSGALHPTLTARYLIPATPGLLLTLVLLAERTPRPRLAAWGLIVVYLASVVRPAAFAEGLRSQSPYGFETASQVLMSHGVTEVVFAWDHEVTAIMPPSTLEGLGGVFFRRAGAPVRVKPLVMRPSDDINALALAAATGSRPGIIWIYNRMGHTAAAQRPPRIPEIDPRWRCERIGDATIGSLACWRD